MAAGGTATDPVRLGNLVSCPELRFAAGSEVCLGPSRVLLLIVCRLVRRLFGLLAVLVWSDLSKDAELLVLRHENQVLRRQLSGRLRWDHADGLWLAPLSRLVSRRPWPETFPVTPATILRWHRDLAPASGLTLTGAGQDDRPPVLRSRR